MCMGAVAALKQRLKGMTKEELRELKRTGKLKELLGDAYDSEASFLRTNTTMSVVTEDGGSSDEEGGGSKRRGKSKNYDSDGSKRRQSKAGKDSKDGAGKKKSKKGKGGSDDESELSGVDRKGKKKKKGKGDGEDGDDDDDDTDAEGKQGKKKGGKGKGGEGEEEEDSDCSYRSEVSEGGTRRKVKMKRLRDKDGNVIGYGDPEVVPDEFRGASVLGREGSVDGGSDEEHNASFKPGDLGLNEDGYDTGDSESRVPAWKRKREQRRQSKLDAQAIAEAAENKQAGETRGSGPDQPMGDTTDRIPSAFSDATTASGDVDLSNMTEEEKAAFLAARELRRKEREERRRAKYGDRYEEIMKKKQQKKEENQKAKLEKERAEQEEKERREEEEKAERERQEKEKLEAENEAKRRRMSSSLKTTGSLLQKKDKPKSMVTYEKAAPRGLGGPIEKTDRRDIGPSHNDWTKNERRLSREDSSMSSYNKLPIFQRMKTTDEGGKGGTSRRRMPDRGELIDREKQRQIAEEAKKGGDNKEEYEDDDLFEIDESGKVRLRLGKKVDLSKISDDMLRKLGIDPNLSKKAKAKLLKKLLGDDVTILDGGRPVGFKGLDEYDLDDITDDMLADDPELDVDTLTGQRRVNVLLRRGGMALREHMLKVMEQSRLMDDKAYRNDLDEKGGSIDFMTHYRLVNPDHLENYARAFVVEDQDLDTVINLNESKTALEGIPAVNRMTQKQLDYVFRVLNITDATQVTFRMFAVITALCERVSAMDPLSKHLLEMCNLADIERKLDLYMNMFYHNRRSDRDGNYIKADSLKIELIAGGLNWKQQQYIMEKMEVNQYGEISFLDYMCYIPLFLSMHDNIVDNPLDMSDQKYTLPPRTRPPSTQRDMNPLGHPLSKKSSVIMRKQARDLMEGKLNTAGLRPETRDRLQRYSRLPPIKPFRRPSMGSHTTSDMSSDLSKTTDFFLGQ